MEEKKPRAMKSRMNNWETALAIGWLPVHVYLLPLLLIRVFPGISTMDLNVWDYAAGTVVLAVLCGRFLRRDFETLCERPGQVLRQVLVSYGLMILMNLLLNQALYAILPEANPNTEAVMDMVDDEPGKSAAMAIFLAPILEELIFRGGVFGLARRFSRVLAYCLSILLFAVYHVWSYGLMNPIYWLFILQYLPITFLLCRCYEKTETIWTPIFLHMLVNAVSFAAENALRGLGA